jgi:two-component system, response regulator PdtaR
MVQPPVGSPLDGRSILVVEDEWLLAMELEGLLDGWGGAVLGPFATAGATVRALADGMPRPEAAILDVTLPDGTSASVAETLLAMGVPFIVLTALPAAYLDSAALRAGRYLSKPCRPAVLLGALRDAIADGGTKSEHGR